MRTHSRPTCYSTPQLSRCARSDFPRVTEIVHRYLLCYWLGVYPDTRWRSRKQILSAPAVSAQSLISETSLPSSPRSPVQFRIFWTCVGWQEPNKRRSQWHGVGRISDIRSERYIPTINDPWLYLLVFLGSHHSPEQPVCG